MSRSRQVSPCRGRRISFHPRRANDKAPDERSVRIEVIPAAPEHEAVLSNLLELYLHDFSELRDIDPGPNAGSLLLDSVCGETNR
jgi:hypothetical protein